MSLLSLDQYRAFVDERNVNKHCTGIACPNCDRQLQFVSPGEYYTSNPMLADIACFDCRYSTRIRVASR